MAFNHPSSPPSEAVLSQLRHPARVDATRTYLPHHDLSLLTRRLHLPFYLLSCFLSILSPPITTPVYNSHTGHNTGESHRSTIFSLFLAPFGPPGHDGLSQPGSYIADPCPQVPRYLNEEVEPHCPRIRHLHSIFVFTRCLRVSSPEMNSFRCVHPSVLNIRRPCRRSRSSPVVFRPLQG